MSVKSAANSSNEPVPVEGGPADGELIGNPVVDGKDNTKLDEGLEIETAVAQYNEETTGQVKADRLQRDTPDKAAHPGEDVEHGA